MHCIPLIRSAGIIISYGLHSSNAGIIVRKSIKLMLEIITIIHSKSDGVAVYQNKKSQRIRFQMKCVFFIYVVLFSNLDFHQGGKIGPIRVSQDFYLVQLIEQPI